MPHIAAGDRSTDGDVAWPTLRFLPWLLDSFDDRRSAVLSGLGDRHEFATDSAPSDFRCVAFLCHLCDLSIAVRASTPTTLRTFSAVGKGGFQIHVGHSVGIPADCEFSLLHYPTANPVPEQVISACPSAPAQYPPSPPNMLRFEVYKALQIAHFWQPGAGLAGQGMDFSGSFW